MLKATFLYSGMVDYWHGNGDRWNDSAGCLFSHYGPDTTLRDLVDGWVDDFMGGGDCDTLPESVGDSDIRAALLAMLNDRGRADYDSGALSEFAIDFADANDLVAGEALDDDEDYGDSPVAIVLIEYEGYEDCEDCEGCPEWGDCAHEKG
jgi:hypothetical protein